MLLLNMVEEMSTPCIRSGSSWRDSSRASDRCKNAKSIKNPSPPTPLYAHPLSLASLFAPHFLLASPTGSSAVSSSALGGS